jgi:hypothetical protein
VSTYTEFVTRVRRELEESSAAVWANASLLDWVNDGIYDLSRRLRSNIDDQYAETVAGVPSYSMPLYTVEVIKMMYGGFLNPTHSVADAASYPISRITPGEYYMRKSLYTTQGTPNSYAIIDGSIFLHPTPDTAGHMHFTRAYRPNPISDTASTADMPWDSRYNDLLSYYVKARAWEQVPDYDQVTLNDNMYQRGAANALLNELNDYMADSYIEPIQIW